MIIGILRVVTEMKSAVKKSGGRNGYQQMNEPQLSSCGRQKRDGFRISDRSAGERAVAGTIVTVRRVADTSGATMAHSSSANTSGTLADRTAMALWKNQFGDRSEVTEA